MKNRLNSLLRDRTTLYFVLSIVMVCIFTLTIAYAVLNTVLEINGNAEVAAANWDIHLDNVKVSSGSVSSTVPTITGKTTATFSATLTNPGDYYQFTIDVVNDGSIDAMIDSVIKTPELTTEQAKYLNYIVEYENGENISNKQLVNVGSFVRLKVRVEYRKDINVSDLPSSSTTLNLSFKVIYIQADENNINVVQNNGKAVKIVSGDYDTVGSEVCINDECFYVISSDNDTVTMLAKYNLYVGNKVTIYDSETDEYTVEPLLDSTGVQNSVAVGSIWNDVQEPINFPWYGTVAFSNDEKHGEVYTDYSGSLVEVYVNNYRNLIESTGILLNDARLILDSELTSLGCVSLVHTCKGTSYLWVYSTSYWTGSKASNNFVYSIYNDGEYSSGRYREDIDFGVRPVIVISKDYFS